jgi:hypothetical protein
MTWGARTGRRPTVAIALTSTLAVWRRWRASMSDPYRPERHYMRGPGPKWRAKYWGRPV